MDVWVCAISYKSGCTKVHDIYSTVDDSGHVCVVCDIYFYVCVFVLLLFYIILFTFYRAL